MLEEKPSPSSPSFIVMAVVGFRKSSPRRLVSQQPATVASSRLILEVPARPSVEGKPPSQFQREAALIHFCRRCQEHSQSVHCFSVAHQIEAASTIALFAVQPRLRPGPCDSQVCELTFVIELFMIVKLPVEYSPSTPSRFPFETRKKCRSLISMIGFVLLFARMKLLLLLGFGGNGDTGTTMKLLLLLVRLWLIKLPLPDLVSLLLSLSQKIGMNETTKVFVGLKLILVLGKGC